MLVGSVFGKCACFNALRAELIALELVVIYFAMYDVVNRSCLMSYWNFESDILVFSGKAQFLLHNLSRLLSGAEVILRQAQHARNQN